jgi:general secretion pathway protein L
VKILGVDIGSFSIKIAELDSSSKGYVLNNYFELPLSVDPNRDRDIEIIEKLREFASRYEAATTKWVIGVPQHKVSLHHKRFPFRERQKIIKSLPFELEDDIPLDIDEVIFDAKVVEYVGPLSETITVASPKEAVKETLSLSKDCGFDPEIVSVEALALSNMFEHWNAGPAEIDPQLRQPNDSGAMPSARSRLVLHMGHARSILLVYREGGLVAVRSLLWGGSDIADSIARTFNVSYFEALKTLQTNSFILMNSAGATKDQLRLSTAVSSSVDILLSELRLILLEVKAGFSLDFERMDLIGGICSIQNLGAYLTAGLEIPTNVGQSVLSSSQSRIPLTPQIEATAPLAVGLAIEGLKRPRNPAVNLRKEEFARENASFKAFLEQWRIPAQIALAAFMIFFVYSLMRDQIAGGLIEKADEQLTEAAKTASLRGASATEAGVRRHVNAQKSTIRNREAFSQIDDYAPALEIVARLSSKLPVVTKPEAGKGIDVSYLKVDNDDVLIEGRAQGAQTVQAIEKALNEIARAKSVEKVTPTQAAAGPGTAFAFKFKVNRKP